MPGDVASVSSPHPSSSAAQIFDGYEKEFLEFTASIARNTASLPNLDGGASPATLDARTNEHAPLGRLVLNPPRDRRPHSLLPLRHRHQVPARRAHRGGHRGGARR